MIRDQLTNRILQPQKCMCLIGASKYRKQRLITERRNRQSTIIGEDVSILLSVINRSRRQIMSKNIEDSNKTTNQLDVIEIYRATHPAKGEHTFQCK